ncbi:3-deoxy-D-manno-octulosonic acid transferase [Rhodobacter capsulatus]|uniref:3-deoxy-D-manno-octulosonic acid transferase n=1 Tax=Rhodobacter capsulatus TaxID=1061 RepID=UPI0040277D68
MTSPRPRPDGWQLRAYLAARPLLQPLMRAVLARRLKQGKEDPARLPEKLGRPTAARPAGRLVWLHAVGLGEVLALRPLIVALQAEAPDLAVLITSTARSSAQVLGTNLPAGAVHQFLPLDGPDFLRGFLDHWRPDLSIWSEQDLWPGAICDTAARGVPLAYVNARIGAGAAAKRARLGGLYRDVLGRFSLIAAQDAGSAGHLRALGAENVRVMRSLKPAAAPLGVDPAELSRFQAALSGRKVWVAASTHAEDEAVVIEAAKALAAQDPAWLLILAPRLPARAETIQDALTRAGLSSSRRSTGGMPDAATQVYLADSFGELGLWYRLARVACVGGSFGPVGGHNPWEAVCLGLPLLAGPVTHNFAADYADLAAAGLAQRIETGPEASATLARAVAETAPAAQDRARALVATARAELEPLARELLALRKTDR